MGSLDEWIQKGYIRKDIWEKLGNYLEPELLTREKIDQCVAKEKQNPKREKLSEGDPLPGHLVSVVSRYVDSSKLTEFALKHLGLKDAHIEMIREDYSDDAKCISFEVEEIYIRIFDTLHILQVSS